MVGFNKEDNYFTFRSLENLLPQLVQIQWKKRAGRGNSMSFGVACQVKPNTPAEDKACLEEVLSPIEKDSLTLGPRKRYMVPPMLSKVIKLKEQLLTIHALQWNLIKAQERLHGMMISINPRSINRFKLNERRKQNG